MKAAAVVFAAAALVAGGGASARVAGGSELAFVAAEDDGRLVALHLEDAPGVAARLRVPRGPHNVAVSRDGRWVLVTSPPAGRVSLVDAHAVRVVDVFAGFRYPHDVEFSHDGRYAYVTEERGARVAVLDLSTRRVARRVAVPAGPHDLAVRPDGRRVWVTHGQRGTSPTILDTSRQARARVIGRAGGRGAHDIAFARDGVFVWVTYWESGIIGKIRAYDRVGRLRLQQRIGDLVHHVQVDSAGRVWATEHHHGEAMRLSSRSGKTVFRLRQCPGAHHVGVGVGRGRVVVACHDDDTALVFDPLSRRTWKIRVGGGPHGAVVAFVP